MRLPRDDDEDRWSRSPSRGEGSGVGVDRRSGLSLGITWGGVKQTCS